MKSQEKLYQFHVENLREINRAMEKIARSLRTFISQSDETSTSSFMRMYSLLLGAWAECRLRKLIYEPHSFINDERNQIQSQHSQLYQWQKTVEIAFRRQYNIPKASLSINVLPHSAFIRYDAIRLMINNDLGSTIELRNKLAHGQWIYPLNKELNDIAQKQMDALRNENFLSLQFKKKLLESLSSVIHDLIVSRPTFERDFDKHFKFITENQRNLQNRDYKKWANKMRLKYNRGKNKRTSHTV